jgi:hypothetical protein
MTKEYEIAWDNFDLVFGEPALLKGESRAKYNFLRKVIAGQLKAKGDIFSQLEVQEITDSVWESRRFKRMGTEMIDAALGAALQYLLQPIQASFKQRADLLAYDYYFGEPENKKSARAMAAGLGITEDRILCQAVAMSGEFRLFDRLVDSRTSQFKRLMKDHDKRLRKAEKHEGTLQRQPQPLPNKDNLVALKKDAA